MLYYIVYWSATIKEEQKRPKSNNNKSHHPQDDRYTYPTITICATGGIEVSYGCDSVYHEYSCPSTIESYIINLGGFDNINGEGYLQNNANENEVRATLTIYPPKQFDLNASNRQLAKYKKRWYTLLLGGSSRILLPELYT